MGVTDEVAENGTIEVLTSEGKPWRVNGAKFENMRAAMMKVLPQGKPGITFAQLNEAVLPHLDAHLFPGGAKSGWWLKSVQLDHEYRGVVAREKGSPMRLYKV